VRGSTRLKRHRWSWSARIRAVRLTASIEQDGRVSFGLESCVSLSALGGIEQKSVPATSLGEPPPATNDWSFWQFRDPKKNFHGRYTSAATVALALASASQSQPLGGRFAWMDIASKSLASTPAYWGRPISQYLDRVFG
jgi:hypothetical protein